MDLTTKSIDAFAKLTMMCPHCGTLTDHNIHQFYIQGLRIQCAECGTFFWRYKNYLKIKSSVKINRGEVI